MKKNILITGAGGREHALAHKLSKGRLAGEVFVAPGNTGIAQDFKTVNLNPSDFEAVVKFCQEASIDLVIAGSEQALVDGLTDYLKGHLPEVRVWGPSKSGAALEGSKAFSKDFMARHGVPTAQVRIFHSGQDQEAVHYIGSLKGKVVLKADGLAAGKGVIITDDIAEAQEIARLMLSGALFGEAGATLLVEEFLEGIEVSWFVMTDGNAWVNLPHAKDYKRVGEGDTGLNTGGMGAVSPVGFCDAAFQKKVEEKVIIPTVEGLKNEGIDYKGFIFIGLMKVGDEPYVIEYNVRLGDPETEAILPRIESDLLDYLWEGAAGNLPEEPIKVSSETAVTVIMASKGYPGPLDKGYPISFGPNPNPQTSWAYHSGTAMNAHGEIINSGGRVLACTAMGKNRSEAKERAYALAESIEFKGAFYRTDISKDLEMWDA